MKQHFRCVVQKVELQELRESWKYSGSVTDVLSLTIPRTLRPAVNKSKPLGFGMIQPFSLNDDEVYNLKTLE